MLRSLALLCSVLLQGAGGRLQGAGLLRKHAAQRVGPTIRGGWPEECVSERERLELDRRLGRGFTAELAGVRAGKAANISKGDTYVGFMEGCTKGKATAVRLEVDTWPSSAKLDVFPLAYYDRHARAFAKPTHSVSGEWQITGSRQEEGRVSFEPAGPVVAGTAGKEFQFGIKAEVDGQHGITGDIVHTGREERLSPTESELKDVPFSCQGFALIKCAYDPPRPDEKVVVFMRHGSASCSQDSGRQYGGDPMLNDIGEGQAADRMSDPNLARMLSADPEESAQVVMMSPMVRTMQTALLAFGRRLPSAKWELDPNLIELGGIGTIVPAAGEELLGRFGAGGLLEQYAAMEKLADLERVNRTNPRHRHKEIKHYHHSHDSDGINLERKEGLDSAWLKNLEKAIEAERTGESSTDLEATEEDLDGPELDERFQRFAQRVWERPEKRFVVVSHKNLLKIGLGLSLEQSATVAMALSEDGWRRLEPNQCWPGFHL